jgi:formate/nitrite transporter FocA (FNT family)
LADEEVRSAYERSVEEGERRLARTWPSLLATGAVGGVDISLGVLALLLVEEATHDPLLGGLAFGIGFVALVLGKGELFTENFLVPIAAVTAGRARLSSVLRLWLGTGVTNLVAGWLITGVVISGLPELRATAVRLASHYALSGLGWRSLCAAILGGAVITLMTWMQRGAESELGRLIAAVAAAFLLVAGSLYHAIVVSLLVFAGLHAGAPFGYLDWLEIVLFASVANIIGGIGFVTVLRLTQVGWKRIERERNAVEQEEDGEAQPASRLSTRSSTEPGG